MKREVKAFFLILLLVSFLIFSTGFNGCEKKEKKKIETPDEERAEEPPQEGKVEEPSQRDKDNLPAGKVLVHSDVDGSFNLLVFSSPGEETPEIGKPFISGPLSLLYKQKKFKITYSITRLAEGSWLGSLDSSAKKLYFFRSNELWVKDIIANKEEKLVSLEKGSWVASRPFLSPGDKKIAFVFNSENLSQPKLAIFDLNSKKLRIFHYFYYSDICWLDEGNLVFQKSKKTLNRLNIVSGNYQEIVKAANIIWSFTLSPDKQKILYYTETNQASEFYLTNPQGKGTKLVYKIDGYQGRPGSYCWLPDNKVVAMDYGGEDVRQFSLFFLDTERGKIIKELRSRATTARPAPGGVRAQVDYLHPVVSLDGKWLLCTRAENIDWGEPPGKMDEKWVLVLYSLDDLSREYQIWDGGNQVVAVKEWKE